jgi:phytoene dehydrogenase-like protein
MTDLLRILPMSVQELLDDTFECEPLKSAIGAGGVHGIRQGPRSGGTAFVLIHSMLGAPTGSLRSRGYWRAGPDAFIAALDAHARTAGATIRTGAAVTHISIRADAVTGVVLEGGEEVHAKLVLSSADPGRTLLGLVDPVWLDPEFTNAVRNIKYRGCTAFVLYALDAVPDFPGLAEPVRSLAGTVSLTPNLDTIERAADAAKYGLVSPRPHVEITLASLRWPDCAPSGRHVLVARAQYAPHALRGGEAWDDAKRDALADSVTAAIQCMAPAFADRILHRVTLSPHDIESRYNLTEGAASHGELTLDQILFMRPVAGYGRHAMPVRGLYLCGAGTHPGPGIPGGAGWLAAAEAIAGGAP